MRKLMAGFGAAALAALGVSAAAQTLQEFPACVTIVATGQSFRLAPMIDTGANLNAITGDDRHDPEATYVVVPWSNGAESVVRMEAGFPTADGSHGEDFEGNAWIISTDVENCG